MPIFIHVIPVCYQDSIILMQAAGKAKGVPGVTEAGFFMGTPSNKAILVQSGLSGPECDGAGPGDIILSVQADNADDAENAFAGAKAFLLSGKKEEKDEGTPTAPLKSIVEAKRAHPDLTLAVISVPGVHARHEAMRALQNNMHVFLFSDNVPLQAEIDLKREAAARDLLCMGPDCGTAWLSGVGIGFANEIPRGKAGIISASGTGMQAVASHLATAGQGLSHGIGVGGRDMHAAVGGSMTFRCLEFLDADPTTEVIILISKPPAPELLPKLEAALAAVKTPCVICMLGAGEGRRSGNHTWVSTLVEAAGTAVTILGGDASRLTLPVFPPPLAARAKRRALLGLYTGGTLAYEAKFIVEPLLGPVAFDDPKAAKEGRDAIIDLGDDAFTVGRPHPMIAPELRAEWLEKLGADPRFGVLLFDLVLGRASHAAPATALLDSLARVRAVNPGLRCIASVTGTDADGQSLSRQETLLREHDVFVAKSNAEAAQIAAAIALGHEGGAA